MLETGRFRHVGATADLRSDARIVAATNRDLRERAREGKFRDDLYYRLSAFVLHVPPLRERRGDLGALAAHFIARRRQALGLPPATLRPDALARLTDYDWPGNVRELRNVIERALILAGDATDIAPEHLGTLSPSSAGRGAEPAAPASAAPMPGALVLQGEPTLEAIEREYLATLLKKYAGNRRKVADALGVSERTAYRMMERHGYK